MEWIENFRQRFLIEYEVTVEAGLVDHILLRGAGNINWFLALISICYITLVKVEGWLHQSTFIFGLSIFNTELKELNWLCGFSTYCFEGHRVKAYRKRHEKLINTHKCQRSKIQAVEMSYLRSGCVNRMEGENIESEYRRFGISGMSCEVVEVVKSSTLRWFGHLERMDES